jgi:hypothetical protein
MMPGSYGYQKSPVNAPKLVFHPYYGFIPATPRKEEAKEEVMDDVEKKAAAKMAYVFDPYYGYIPYVAKKDEMMEKKEQQMFEYHPYYGYIPYVAKKDGEMAKEETEMMAEKLVYHPYYGFIRMSQLKGMEKEVKENQVPKAINTSLLFVIHTLCNQVGDFALGKPFPEPALEGSN